MKGLLKFQKPASLFQISDKKTFSDLKSRISEGIEVPKTPLTVGPFNVAVLVRNAADSVKYGIEQRDAAIRAGALGATTLIFRQNRLVMPGIKEDVFQNVRPTLDMLVSAFKPSENDVIIIGSATDKRTAELGAKTAALELLKSVFKHKLGFERNVKKVSLNSSDVKF